MTAALCGCGARERFTRFGSYVQVSCRSADCERREGSERAGTIGVKGFEAARGKTGERAARRARARAVRRGK